MTCTRASMSLLFIVLLTWCIPARSQTIAPAGSSAELTANFTVVCTGLTCALDASPSTGPIAGYLWRVGKQPASDDAVQGRLVIVTYPIPGRRTISLTIIDSVGKRASATSTVSITDTGTVTATTSSEASAAVAGAMVTLDGTIRYQRIDGWATNLQMWDEDKRNNRFDPSIEHYDGAVASYLVRTVGINAVRLPILSGWENPRDDWTPFRDGSMSYAEFALGRYEKFNDNNDPNITEAGGFQFAQLDYKVERSLLPMKQLIEAQGEQLYINVNFTDFNWNGARQGTLSHANTPKEFAEFVLVYFQHLRDKYGLTPDAFELILEPENTAGWSGTNIGAGLVAVADRLRQHGFRPEFIAPSTTAMNNTLPYLKAMFTVLGADSLLSTLAYHRYGAESATTVDAIHRAAEARGLKTAMLEKVDGRIDQLMEDLTVGHVSSWQQWSMAGRSSNADNGGYYGRVTVGQPGVAPARHTNQLAQVFRNVRRGAVRIGSQSTAAGHVTAAFVNPDSTWVVVVRARHRGGDITIAGLPPGSYTLSFTSDGGVNTLPQRIAVTGAFTTRIQEAGVLVVRGVP